MLVLTLLFGLATGFRLAGATDAPQNSAQHAPSIRYIDGQQPVIKGDSRLAAMAARSDDTNAPETDVIPLDRQVQPGSDDGAMASGEGMPAYSSTEIVVSYSQAEAAESLASAALESAGESPADDAFAVASVEVGAIEALPAEEDVTAGEFMAESLQRTLEEADIAVQAVTPEENEVVDDGGLLTVELAAGQSMDGAIEAIESCEGVEYAQPLMYYYAEGFNDPKVSLQWGLDVVDAYDMYSDPAVRANIGNVTIAVLDSGIRQTHEDLQASVVAGYDFIGIDDNPNDDFGHGTHVAGIAAAIANNSKGVASPGSGAKIMPVRVLNAAGRGDTLSLRRGIQFAADNGADILNMSLGGSAADTDATVEAAVNYALGKGCLVVAAAGNDKQKNLISYPARYEGVLAVGALSLNTSDGTYYESDYSNYEAACLPRMLYAPGTQILSTTFNGDKTYDYRKGTSMATPLVSGMAAALKAKSGGTLSGAALMNELFARSLTQTRRFEVVVNNVSTIRTDSATYRILNDDGTAGQVPDVKTLIINANGGSHEVTANDVQVQVSAQSKAGVTDGTVSSSVSLYYQLYEKSGENLTACGTKNKLTGTLVGGTVTLPLDLSKYPNGSYVVVSASDDSQVFRDSDTFYLQLNNGSVFSGHGVTITVNPPPVYTANPTPALLPTAGVDIMYSYFDSVDGDIERSTKFLLGTTSWENGKYTLTVPMAPGKYQFYCNVLDDERYAQLSKMGSPVVVSGTTVAPAYTLVIDDMSSVGTLTLGGASLPANFTEGVFSRAYALNMNGWSTPAAKIKLTGVQTDDITVECDGQAIDSRAFVDGSDTNIYFRNDNYPNATNGVYTITIRSSAGKTGSVQMVAAYAGWIQATTPDPMTVYVYAGAQSYSISNVDSETFFFLDTPTAKIEYRIAAPTDGYLAYGVVNKTEGTFGMKQLGKDMTELGAADLNASCIAANPSIPVTAILKSSAAEAAGETGGTLTSGQAKSGNFDYYEDADDYNISIIGSSASVSMTAQTDFQFDLYRGADTLVRTLTPVKSGDNYVISAVSIGGLTSDSYRVVLSSVDSGKGWPPYKAGLFVNGGYSLTVTDAAMAGSMTLNGNAVAASFIGTDTLVYTLNMTGWNTSAAKLTLTGIEASNLTVTRDGQPVACDITTAGGNTEAHFTNGAYPSASGAYVLTVKSTLGATGTAQLAGEFRGKLRVTVPSGAVMTVNVYSGGEKTAFAGLTATQDCYFSTGTAAAQVEFLLTQCPNGYVPYGGVGKNGSAYETKLLGADFALLNGADLGASQTTAIPVTPVLVSTVTEAVGEAGGTLTIGQEKSGTFDYYMDEDDFVFTWTEGKPTITMTSATDYKVELYDSVSTLLQTLTPTKTGQAFILNQEVTGAITPGTYTLKLISVDSAPGQMPLQSGLFFSGGYTVKVSGQPVVTPPTPTGSSGAGSSGGSQQVIRMPLANVPYTSGKDGAVVPAFTKENLKKVADGTTGTDLPLDFRSVPDMKGLDMTLTPALLETVKGKTLKLITAYGSLALPADGLSGTVNIKLNKGVFDVEILTNGKPFHASNLQSPMLVSIPYQLKAGESSATLTMMQVDGSAGSSVVPRSFYRDGMVSAWVYKTGKFDVKQMGASEFIDTKGQWMSPAVTYMTARGIVNGVGQNKFAPDRVITREQFITMIMRTLAMEFQGELPPVALSDQSDVSAWALSSVTHAYALGIISVDNSGKFDPKAPITRQDMFFFAYTAMDKFGMLPDEVTGQAVTFKDWSSVKQSERDAVQTLAKLELIQGNQGNLRPMGTSTRAEGAQFLNNILLFEQK